MDQGMHLEPSQEVNDHDDLPSAAKNKEEKAARKTAKRVADEVEAVNKRYEKLYQLTLKTTRSMGMIILEKSEREGTTILMDNMREWAMYCWASANDEYYPLPIELQAPANLQQNMIRSTIVMMVEFALVEEANGIHGHNPNFTLSEEMKAGFDLTWEQLCGRLSWVLNRSPQATNQADTAEKTNILTWLLAYLLALCFRYVLWSFWVTVVVDLTISLCVYYSRSKNHRHNLKHGFEIKTVDVLNRVISPDYMPKKNSVLMTSITNLLSSIINKSLLCAARIGQLEISDTLLKISAKVNFADSNGFTALMGAAEAGHEAVVKLLLAKGAKVNACSKYKDTALSLSTKEGREVIVKILLEKGAEVDFKGTSGFTPLMWAAKRGHEAVLELLLANGASNNDKDTALSLATQEGHEAIVKTLLEKGAKVDSTFL